MMRRTARSHLAPSSLPSIHSFTIHSSIHPFIHSLTDSCHRPMMHRKNIFQGRGKRKEMKSWKGGPGPVSGVTQGIMIWNAGQTGIDRCIDAQYDTYIYGYMNTTVTKNHYPEKSSQASKSYLACVVVGDPVRLSLHPSFSEFLSLSVCVRVCMCVFCAIDFVVGRIIVFLFVFECFIVLTRPDNPPFPNQIKTNKSSSQRKTPKTRQMDERGKDGTKKKTKRKEKENPKKFFSFREMVRVVLLFPINT